MSAQTLLLVLEKLLKLHKSLYQIAQDKTEVLKKGDIEALNQLMKNEQSHISAIQMIDKERAEIISKMIPKQKNPTLRDCIALLDKPEVDKIVSIQEQLLSQITLLKEVNELNQDLLTQSLQYVSLNLDFLLPNQSVTYSKEQDSEQDLPNLSLFDSKA